MRGSVGDTPPLSSWSIKCYQQESKQPYLTHTAAPPPEPCFLTRTRVHTAHAHTLNLTGGEPASRRYRGLTSLHLPKDPCCRCGFGFGFETCLKSSVPGLWKQHPGQLPLACTGHTCLAGAPGLACAPRTSLAALAAAGSEPTLAVPPCSNVCFVANIPSPNQVGKKKNSFSPLWPCAPVASMCPLHLPCPLPCGPRGVGTICLLHTALAPEPGWWSAESWAFPEAQQHGRKVASSPLYPRTHSEACAPLAVGVGVGRGGSHCSFSPHRCFQKAMGSPYRRQLLRMRVGLNSGATTMPSALPS